MGKQITLISRIMLAAVVAVLIMGTAADTSKAGDDGAGAPQNAYMYWVNVNDFDDTSMIMYGGIDPWGTGDGKTCEIRCRVNSSDRSGANFWPLQLAVRFGGNSIWHK